MRMKEGDKQAMHTNSTNAADGPGRNGAASKYYY